MERFIFDLDGTLLFGNFNIENEYFREVLNPVDAEKFIKMKYNLLMDYEMSFLKYDIKNLSSFLTKNSKVQITEKMITEWIDINANMKDKKNEDAIEVLEYLKQKNKSIVVLTNWFSKTQIQRLKNAELYDYFDNVYCGDLFLKPNIMSYIYASGAYEYEDCLMIGDSYEKDVIGPKMLGINALFYHKDSDIKDNKEIIKSLKKIKEIY